MIRKLVCFAMIMIAINSYWENKIKLVLNDCCEFVSDQGKNFVVIEYPGKTAHEIFDGINTNIVKIFIIVFQHKLDKSSLLR